MIIFQKPFFFFFLNQTSKDQIILAIQYKVAKLHKRKLDLFRAFLIPLLRLVLQFSILWEKCDLYTVLYKANLSIQYTPYDLVVLLFEIFFELPCVWSVLTNTYIYIETNISLLGLLLVTVSQYKDFHATILPLQVAMLLQYFYHWEYHTQVNCLQKHF